MLLVALQNVARMNETCSNLQKTLTMLKEKKRIPEA